MNQQEDVSMIEVEQPVAPTKDLINKPSMQAKPEEKDALDKKASRSSNKQTTNKPFTTPAELADQLEYQTKLGEGTYGIVYSAKVKDTGKIVAVKEIKIDSCQDGIPSTAIREIAVLQELKEHPHIINLDQIVHGENKDRLFLVFEFFNQDMKKYLDQLGEPMSKAQVKSVLYQLLKGVEYCHERRIMHRDLKPSNLLINGDENQIKIADFGLARTMGLPLKSYTHEVVTLWYRAPEVLLGSKVYSTAIDMWSIGAIFFELAHKKPLFAGDSEIGQIFKIFKTLGTPTEETWQGFEALPEMKMAFPKWTVSENQNIRRLCKNFDETEIELLISMVHLEPSRRISAKTALRHPYFNDVRHLEFPAFIDE